MLELVVISMSYFVRCRTQISRSNCFNERPTTLWTPENIFFGCVRSPAMCWFTKTDPSTGLFEFLVQYVKRVNVDGHSSIP